MGRMMVWTITGLAAGRKVNCAVKIGYNCLCLLQRAQSEIESLSLAAKWTHLIVKEYVKLFLQLLPVSVDPQLICTMLEQISPSLTSETHRYRLITVSRSCHCRN